MNNDEKPDRASAEAALAGGEPLPGGEGKTLAELGVKPGDVVALRCAEIQTGFPVTLHEILTDKRPHFYLIRTAEEDARIKYPEPHPAEAALAGGEPLPGAPGGEAIHELGAKPGDMVRCVAATDQFTVGKTYIVGENGGIPYDDGRGYCTTSTSRFVIIPRPAEPAPADVDWEQRRWEAMLAALTGIMANPVRWQDIKARYDARTMTYEQASASNARKAVSIADALITAAQEKRHDG